MQEKETMYKGVLGAVIGDIVGSRFEWHNYKGKDFELFVPQSHFTDDTAMTIAIGKALSNCNGNYQNLSQEAIRMMQEIGRQYADCGYGGGFKAWLNSDDPQPYNSWGNGSAMRVSACAYFAQSMTEAKLLSQKVTEITHNHPEGMKGAEAATVATFMALNGDKKDKIKEYISKHYYSMDFNLDDIRAEYHFHVSCQKSVPQALKAFFESENYEDAIRNAISIGGDSDTIAAITGGVACAYYGMPRDIAEKGLSYLDDNLRVMVENIDDKAKALHMQSALIKNQKQVKEKD